MKIFSVVGSHGLVLTSTDSINWVQQRSATQQSLQSVTSHKGRFVAVGGHYQTATIFRMKVIR